MTALNSAVNPRIGQNPGMTIAMNWPSSTLRSQRLALGLMSVSALLIGGIELGDTLSLSPADELVRVLSLIVAWIFVGAGVLAWSRRPVNQLGFVISSADSRC